MDTIKFIEHIESQVRSIIEKNHPFIGFSLICLGIEMLGSFYDQFPADEKGHSESRFDNGIDKLLPRYRPYKKILFEQLRGGFVHQLKPGKGLLLSSEKHDSMPRKKNLEKVEEKLLLVIEEFLDDYSKASAKIVKNIRANKFGEIDKKKVLDVVISIRKVDFEDGPKTVSAGEDIRPTASDM